MQTEKNVFLLKASILSDRPFIDFTDPENKTNDWLLCDKVLRGNESVGRWPDLQIQIYEYDATEWDLYDGADGLIVSEKGKGVLERFCHDRISFLKCHINQDVYYFLKKEAPLACLDLDRSQIEPIPGFPGTCMEITKYCFDKNKIADPSVFCIPELWNVFVTESALLEIQQAGLKGFEFYNTEYLVGFEYGKYPKDVIRT